MARRGRKPIGANLVEHLEGSERAKTRFKAILETLSGQRTIPDVCQELGIQESMFHRVRGEVLQTALDRLEPRPLGRPPLPSNPQDARVAELEEENLKLRVELKAAEVRRELAENLPRLAKPADRPGKKTTSSTTRHLRRKPPKRSRRSRNNKSR
jgi:transposase-like protein